MAMVNSHMIEDEEVAMPAQQRVTPEALVAAVREIAERDGVDGVTMSAVAAAVGVRAPSLYKRAAGRHDLLRLAADDATAEMLAAMRAAAVGPPREALAGAARALRAFAARAPRATTLIFSAPGPAAGPSPAAMAPAMDFLLSAIRPLAPEDPLSAARTLTAWAYGFCTMEQNGAFRQGGDVDEAFERGLDAVLRGLGA
ncbi:AcrR family transcriptional regulator [Microbacterium resistens]|uniref:AcrR family transcriptional regulator n=1 Tax=Microbacterium resistens TaxID=156977 RepID=A0ABU1SES5_9MICO|nr:TetR-like C-terminal domain-containing protein [Microbacterium resistens]MDR6868108.1 AcrR family transcriptional regulator [Microbacterium resistens]